MNCQVSFGHPPENASVELEDAWSPEWYRESSARTKSFTALLLTQCNFGERRIHLSMENESKNFWLRASRSLPMPNAVR